MKKILIAFPIILITLISMVIALDTVTFSGVWSNGTTLYSDSVYVSNYFYGKDVYKDSSTITSGRLCTTETINYKKPVCETTTTYTTRWVRIRRGYVVTYELITKPRTKRTCHSEIFTKEVENCRRVRTRVGCLNPDGKYTNQLNLENFEYSLDGTNWNKVPYPNDKIEYSGYVRFRVNIPDICSPVYYYNKAIFFS